MSLAKQLNQLVTSGEAWVSNRGCQTCHWLTKLSRDDRQAFDQWVESGKSISQLWEVCCQEDPSYPVSLSGLRNHLKHHVAG